VVQGFGVAELGWGYPAKFINTPALEKGDVMTFGVGFLELISEISKIISFAFRLFGNIFAGQILLFVIPFLIATLLPGCNLWSGIRRRLHSGGSLCDALPGVCQHRHDRPRRSRRASLKSNSTG
jgi:F0F1-type ATP synthase membrane subunit a